MNMPGFTAEASLYKTSRHYSMAGTVDQSSGTIYPAILRGANCFRNCLNSLCVREDDPYCYDNCQCICHGIPGRTCWLM